MTTKDVGTFEVKSGKVLVTDPCYDRETAKGEVKAKNGKWVAQAYVASNKETRGFGNRVAGLFVYHSDFPMQYPARKLPFTVGVDSGQAGVFCDSVYPQGETGEYGDETSFYGRACKETEKELAGIVDGAGVVSSSGFGDGGYDAFASYDGDEVVGIRILFIDDKEE